MVRLEFEFADYEVSVQHDMRNTTLYIYICVCVCVCVGRKLRVIEKSSHRYLLFFPARDGNCEGVALWRIMLVLKHQLPIPIISIKCPDNLLLSSVETVWLAIRLLAKALWQSSAGNPPRATAPKAIALRQLSTSKYPACNGPRAFLP